MQAKGDFRLVPIEHALLQHQLRAAFFTRGRAFLCRLKHEQHVARQILLHRGQHFGDAHQDRGVAVVSAGMHDAHRLAAECRGDARTERQIHLFGNRQAIHVGAQHDRRPWAAAFQQRDDARLRHAGFDGQTEPTQMIRDELRSPELAVRQFGVLVQIATPRDHSRQNRFDTRCRLRREIHRGAFARGLTPRGDRHRRENCNRPRPTQNFLQPHGTLLRTRWSAQLTAFGGPSAMAGSCTSSIPLCSIRRRAAA